MKGEYICAFCKNKEVVIVPEYFPWSDKHWACPLCDSTYDISEYPKNNKSEISSDTIYKRPIN